MLEHEQDHDQELEPQQEPKQEPQHRQHQRQQQQLRAAKKTWSLSSLQSPSLLALTSTLAQGIYARHYIAPGQFCGSRSSAYLIPVRAISMLDPRGELRLPSPLALPLPPLFKHDEVVAEGGGATKLQNCMGPTIRSNYFLGPWPRGSGLKHFAWSSPKRHASGLGSLSRSRSRQKASGLRYQGAYWHMQDASILQPVLCSKGHQRLCSGRLKSFVDSGG